MGATSLVGFYIFTRWLYKQAPVSAAGKERRATAERLSMSMLAMPELAQPQTAAQRSADLRSIRRVLVASKAAQKLGAVGAVLRHIGVDTEAVQGVSGVKSGVSEQPFGNEETTAGALNRLVHTTELVAGLDKGRAHGGGSQVEPVTDIVVAFENGIVAVDMPIGYAGDAASASTAYFDTCWVVVQRYNSATGQAAGPRVWAHSVGLEVAANHVEMARARPGGFSTTTAGAVIAEQTGCDPQDPHEYLTAEVRTRQALMQDALMAALGQLSARKGFATSE
jgi:non-canonical (house-cleaning) NTP pyrophosphatase